MTGRGKTPASSAVDALYRVTACKSPRCNRCAIAWMPTARVHPRTGQRIGTGAPVPLDHGKDAHGLVVLDKHHTTGAWQARPFELDSDDPGRPRYSVHWSSCHTPELYRQVRAAADPRGLFPPLMTRGPRDANDGPCAGCGTTCHRYGPGGSPLCLECVRPVVAAWGPSMRSTIASWPEDLRRARGVADFQ